MASETMEVEKRIRDMYAAEVKRMPTNHDFEGLYKTHHARVLSLCRYLLNSNESAEDAVHEVFLRAQRSISTYDSDRPIAGWIIGIATNYCVDQLRRRSTETRIFSTDDTEPASAGLSPLSSLMLMERGRDVKAALAELPERYRVPLVMAYYNEWTYDQIAETLGLNRNHVATLIFRAKQQLREALAQHAYQGAKK